jgi:dipeptidase D
MLNDSRRIEMSHHLVAELEPKVVWKHFDALVKIPRPSGHEEKVRQHLLDLAAKKGLKSGVDPAGNVVIFVPATTGRENAPAVVLQGHLDIVGEKNSDVKHDFVKDPIKAIVDGDYVKAVGTTLGADNGIGLAAALAVAEDPECVHGPVEILCTVDEETGLTGANKLDASPIKGRMLVNLDSEEDGAIFIGCAGGVTGYSSIKCPVQKTPAGVKFFEVKVSGLKGGHSGLDINQNRANSHRVMAATLKDAVVQTGALLYHFEGGSKHNAIPREAFARLAVPKAKVDAFKAAVAASENFQKTLAGRNDPDLKIECAEASGRPRKVWTKAAGLKVIKFLLALPHGVLAMSKDVPGLVETSSNLAIVKTGKDGVEVVTSSRSSVSEALTSVIDSIESLAALAGAKIRHEGRYPGWRPDPESALLKKAQTAFKGLRGFDAHILAVHAGLECGIIMEKLPGMQAISFGPALYGVHSPDEKLQISTVGPFYNFLKELLKALA